MSNNKTAFADGLRDGIPIAAGYFAVAFSLGIVAKKAGLTPFQGFLSSILNHASAGEYAEFTVISAGAPYLEMAFVILITNMRYLLMSCALSQKFDSATRYGHRLLVGFGKMPPFVVTLGTMLIYRSLTLSVVRKIDPAISGSSSSQFAMLSDNSKYEFLRMKFGTGKLALGGFSIPYITFVFLIMAILFIVISKKTKYGKTIYAVGSNEKSARLAGINVTWVKISVFILTGICVGVASMLQACKIGNVTPASSGVSYEMYAIASVVLAGVSMAGGKGNMVGVIFGALSYTTINFIIVSIPGLSVDIQDTFQGLVLIVVILIQTVGPVIKENLQRAQKRRQAAGKA